MGFNESMMRKAVVLAAGRGTRLGSLTDDRPKPMVPIGCKPILEHVMDRLVLGAYTDALIVTGYHAEMVEGYFRDYPMRIQFRRQDVPNGTASAALLGREFCGPDAFLLVYGDCLAEAESYRGILDVLERDPEAEAALAVRDVDDPFQGAAVYVEDGRIVRIIEKPPKGTSTTRWNSAGFYSFRPSIFDELARVPLSPRGEYELTHAVEVLLSRGRVLRHFPVEGFWRDIGRPEDIDAVLQEELGPANGATSSL